MRKSHRESDVSARLHCHTLALIIDARLTTHGWPRAVFKKFVAFDLFFIVAGVLGPVDARLEAWLGEGR